MAKWSISVLLGLLTWYVVLFLPLTQDDRVDRQRSCEIGKIEVVRYKTSFSHKEMRLTSSRSKKVDFTQANKKDVKEVTKNAYCMATTRRGKLIHTEKPYSRPNPDGKASVKNIWTIGDELDKLHVEYHMTQSLLDWGIQPVRPNWSQSGSTVLCSSSSEWINNNHLSSPSIQNFFATIHNQTTSILYPIICRSLWSTL